MGNRRKIIFWILGIVCIVTVISYFYSPVKSLEKGSKINLDELIGNSYKSSDFNHGLEFIDSQKCRVSGVDSNSVTFNQIYAFSYNEGIIAINDNLSYQVLEKERIFECQNHYFLYEVKII